jgi:hypothetical protein
MLVNQHGIFEIVSRDCALEVTWPLESPQVLVELRGRKDNRQVGASVAVQFWNQ